MPKFDCLLFDADDTLLDSGRAFPAAIVSSFQSIGLEVDDELIERYESINGVYWQKFERGEITLEEIKKDRFRTILTGLNIDHDPEEFNQLYLAQLVEVTELFDGVMDLLNRLSEDFRMCIITNGMKEAQRPRLRKTGIYDFFESIIVSDEIGYSKPDTGFFDVLIKGLDNPPAKEKMLIIGDGLGSDIKGGMNYGIPTCWISHGKTNERAVIQPTFEIEKVTNLPEILF